MHAEPAKHATCVLLCSEKIRLLSLSTSRVIHKAKGIAGDLTSSGRIGLICSIGLLLLFHVHETKCILICIIVCHARRCSIAHGHAAK